MSPQLLALLWDSLLETLLMCGVSGAIAVLAGYSPSAILARRRRMQAPPDGTPA